MAVPKPEHAPRYSDLPLPEWRCIPVHSVVPDRARLDPVTAAVPERLDAEEAAAQPAFLFGADLYNRGFFWEAHEVWEPVWMALAPNSRERTACRALIQGANACLKLRFGWSRAFFRLSAEVSRLAREADPGGQGVLGVALDQWRAEFEAFAAWLGDENALELGFDTAEVEAFPYLRITRR